MAAGRRKKAATPCLRRRAGSAAAGGAPSRGGSAVMLAPPATLLLVECLGRGGLQRRSRSVDVLGVLQEVLEDLPLALAGRRAERRRLEIGEVEARHLRPNERLRRGAR